ncbi:hypothetical protein HRI_004039800 [Hibiscus trionum]|uniref:Magnesium transporter n=1 Tax=Hibiscus trionum TaxID=183268 RepID=A0A9W7IXJ1_HIBTR|nr:hypothetical protein HRI_004039800 [Hibiscus trionum]
MRVRLLSFSMSIIGEDPPEILTIKQCIEIFRGSEQHARMKLDCKFAYDWVQWTAGCCLDGWVSLKLISRACNMLAKRGIESAALSRAIFLCLSRKLAWACSPVSGSGAPNWYPSSPTIGSKISRTSRGSAVTIQEDNDVEELEMLLEAYFMQIDSTLNKLTTLREYIDDTEDYINIQLDNHRNQLIQLELFLSSGTVCLSIYSLVAAIFGMNIPYTWNNGHEHMFKWVIILTGLLCTSTFTSIMSYARHKGLIGS